MSQLVDIDVFKRQMIGAARYKLSDANVFLSPGGFHCIDYLDPPVVAPRPLRDVPLSESEITYIERSLQSNDERFSSQLATVKKYVALSKARLLDIGCGGGLFLTKARECGADPVGVELSETRAKYATSRHALEIVQYPVEHEVWANRSGEFDAVSLWDVIEHVNYPQQTLHHAIRLLKPGGYLFIDTPCRDAFYHRMGALTYRLTAGRFPTFLNTLYSQQPFGHKQIFSTDEMRALFEDAKLEVVDVGKFHELSFPIPFYLKRMLKSDWLVRMAVPLVSIALFIFPVRNKMLVVGRKPLSG